LGNRKQGNITFVGKSGERYPFEVWPLETRFRPLAAVYFVTKRAYGSDTYRRASHDAIYIGRTEDLAGSLADPAALARYAKFGANCVCTLVIEGLERGLAVEQDLLAQYSTHCNHRQRAESVFAESGNPG